MTSSARFAASAASTCSSMMVMSGLTKIPPLNPATGVRRANGSISIAMPRGGRPLVIAKAMPAACSAFTAARARGVSTFSAVTSVPSTSARTSEIFDAARTGSTMRDLLLSPAPTRARERPPPRMNRSIALAKPSSRLLSVTKSAFRCTCGLALPMAMLRPARSNIATSLPPSPMTAISASGIPNSFAISANAAPLLASGWVMSR